jgi:hypothetical protein
VEDDEDRKKRVDEDAFQPTGISAVVTGGGAVQVESSWPIQLESNAYYLKNKFLSLLSQIQLVVPLHSGVGVGEVPGSGDYTRLTGISIAASGARSSTSLKAGFHLPSLQGARLVTRAGCQQ